MSPDVLSPRALNRATLARQLLLRRAKKPSLAAVEHLVGMQAQVPLNPYLGLWSRLDGFQPEELGQLLLDRTVVRIVVMRATIHLVTAEDALVLRPLTQRVLDAEIARHPEFSPALVDVDLDEVLGFAAEIPPHLAPTRSSGLHSRSGTPTSPPPRSRTRAAAGSRSCRYLRAACGGAPGRSHRRPRSRG